MILPTSQIAVLLLLVLAFFCLGSWINSFKSANSRFEFFAIDFALGALLLSILAAYTLGSFGSDLTFADRFLVASRTAQGMAISAAFLFALGNTLLLAGVAILGISVAFPLSIGLALLIGSVFYLSSANLVLFIPGLIASLLSSYLGGRASRFRKTPPVKSGSRRGGDRTFWGVMVTVLSGIALGFVYPLIVRGITGDFGLAAYAGLVLFCAILLVSTLVLDFFFVRIGVEGKGVTTEGAYFGGKAARHIPGLIGGAVWAIGALAVFLAVSAPPAAAVSPGIELGIPLSALILAVFWGVVRWKEVAGTPKAKSSIVLSAVVFLCALVLLGWSFGQ